VIAPGASPAPASGSADGHFTVAVDAEPASPRVEARAEYLLWWLKGDRPALPLLTTGAAGGGALGASDTAVLFRLSDLSKDVPYDGARFGLGFWGTPEGRLGLNGDFFFLQKRTFTFAAASDAGGSPLLSVPFNDVNPAFAGPSFSQISVPGALTGGVAAISTTRLWGAGGDVLLGLIRSEGLSVDGLVGYRHVDLLESFAFTQHVTAITGNALLSFQGSPVPADNSLLIADRFGTHNLFDGCDLGLRMTWSPFSTLAVDLTTKVALGTATEKLNVAGVTNQLSPAGAVVQTAPGGLFALWAANIGETSHNEFAVIPEVILCLRYSVTEWLSVSVGCDFLYWSNLQRPGDQVSGTINSGLAPSQIPFANGGSVAPPPLFRHTDFSAQGLNFGFELRF
jgi:hypothetical protein